MRAPERLDPDALAALEEQQRFLRQSIADIEREHAAGDLDEDDFATLLADYRSRLAVVDQAVETGRISLRTRSVPRPRGRTALVAVLVVLFAVICGFAVAQVAGRRDPGESATGSITGGAREARAECLASFTQERNLPVAVACYDEVVAEFPEDHEARTYAAGLRVVQGDYSHVTELIEVATAEAGYPDVHAFLALAFEGLGRPDSALAELSRLDALNPPAIITQLVAPLRERLLAATANASD